MGSAPRDDNRVPSLIAKSDANNTPIVVEADPATNRLKVNATITGTAQLAGDVASGATDSGNPVKIGGVYKTTPDTLTDGQRGNVTLTTKGALRTTLVTDNSVTVFAARADNADGVANSATTNNLAVVNRNTLANGSNWDRQNVVADATNSVGTGIAAAGVVAQFDDVSPTAITENQFGNLRMSANRNAYTTLRDAAGNERGANVNASNQMTVISDITLSGTALKDDAVFGDGVVIGVASVAIRAFNGTSYDRVRSDGSGNLKVTTVGGLMPTGTALNAYSVHLTTNTTATPTSATAYISSISISNEVGGTTSTVTIQDKQGTPLKLINGFSTTSLTTTPTVVNFQTPVKMVSGIDIITAGAVAATVDVWVNYYQ